MVNGTSNNIIHVKYTYLLWKVFQMLSLESIVLYLFEKSKILRKFSSLFCHKWNPYLTSHLRTSNYSGTPWFHSWQVKIASKIWKIKIQHARMKVLFPWLKAKIIVFIIITYLFLPTSFDIMKNKKKLVISETLPNLPPSH